MELNEAQLLVHNDEALENFKRVHGIPANVQIEHPELNDEPRMENNSDYIPVRIW